MIDRMTKYSFILLSSASEGFLEKLAETGVVDISRSSRPVDEHSAQLLNRSDELKKKIAWLEKEDFSRDPEYAAILEKTDYWKKELALREPWGDFDLSSVEAFERKSGCTFRFYAVSEKSFNPAWENLCPLEKIATVAGKVYFVTVSDSEDYSFPATECARPLGSAAEARAMLASLGSDLQKRAEELRKLKEDIPSMREQYQSILSELEIYLASQTRGSAAEGYITQFTGFAPVEEDERLKAEFDAMDVYWLAEPASVDDDPPIQLKNNRFSRPFEVLTSMYGLPVYNEFDPTVFLSIFFLLFFSMCMGDAGYGILLIIIGQALKKSSGSLAKMHSLVTILGCGTVLAGLVMGGFFGVSLYEVSWIPEWYKSIILTGELAFTDAGVQWFKSEAEVASIPEGAAHYSLQMVIAVVIGILHVSLAMIVKTVWAIRRDGFKNSLSTLGWTILIVGAVIVACVAMFGVLSESAIKWIVIGIAAVSALGIFVFNKWGRNPLVNIGLGVWDTYQTVSGLMSDVLSYIRLYALGLSGGMLGATFNLMANMVKGEDPTWQWIPFVIILIIGHVLNLAMSCLGAFVHPLRLNFLEFFKNSGYEGRGAKYNPLKK